MPRTHACPPARMVIASRASSSQKLQKSTFSLPLRNHSLPVSHQITAINRERNPRMHLVVSQITELPSSFIYTTTSLTSHVPSLIAEMDEIPLRLPPVKLQHITRLLCLVLSMYSLLSLPARASNPCDPSKQRDHQTLLSDQITVLINGYSESRIPLLHSVAATYSASPLVSSVLVLWGNPSTPAQTLAQLSHNLTLSSFGQTTISVVRQPSSSLNSRFLPRRSIQTHAVLICDDDIEVDPTSFEFAYRIWRSNPDRLIGFFVRSHDIDLSTRKWIYTVHPDKYSIVLTKFMILKSDYLFRYSCKGGDNMGEMRRTVDRMKNCEDILMNFVVADETNAGPILVGAERVRDWGDARNDNDDEGVVRGDGGLGGGSRVKEVGLSSRRAEHRKRRGECIKEFHKLMGRMPLRYSYGKVVNSVGEQGLCLKGGKLVFCDQ